MKSDIDTTKEQISVYASISHVLPTLQQLKKEDKRKVFRELMGDLLPEVNHYIKRQLAASVRNKTLPVGKFKAEDLTDELYIEAYEHIQNLNNEGELRSWLFAKANKVLEDTIIDQDFYNTYFKNIDDYTGVEWEAMNERFTRDGDGDLIMLEELDDISYSKYNYTLSDVFIEKEEDNLVDQLSERINSKEVQLQIESALIQLPFQLRSVYELSVIQKFSPIEIAKIKKISSQEVSQNLIQAKNIMWTYFLKKHFD